LLHNRPPHHPNDTNANSLNVKNTNRLPSLLLSGYILSLLLLRCASALSVLLNPESNIGETLLIQWMVVYGIAASSVLDFR